VGESQPAQVVHETLSRKYPKGKKTWWINSSGRVLPSKYELLSSNTSITKKNKEEEK
jgi:hypothetical protein